MRNFAVVIRRGTTIILHVDFAVMVVVHTIAARRNLVAAYDGCNPCLVILRFSRLGLEIGREAGEPVVAG